MTIDRNDIIHPEDKAAIATLEAVPGFTKLAKWVMSKYWITYNAHAKLLQGGRGFGCVP